MQLRKILCFTADDGFRQYLNLLVATIPDTVIGYVDASDEGIRRLTAEQPPFSLVIIDDKLPGNSVIGVAGQILMKLPSFPIVAMVSKITPAHRQMFEFWVDVTHIITPKMSLTKAAAILESLLPDVPLPHR